MCETDTQTEKLTDPVGTRRKNNALLRRNDVATLSWRNNDASFTPCARWGNASSRKYLLELGFPFAIHLMLWSAQHYLPPCEGNHRWPVVSPHKGLVVRKTFPWSLLTMSYEPSTSDWAFCLFMSQTNFKIHRIQSEVRFMRWSTSAWNWRTNWKTHWSKCFLTKIPHRPWNVISICK